MYVHSTLLIASKCDSKKDGAHTDRKNQIPKKSICIYVTMYDCVLLMGFEDRLSNVNSIGFTDYYIASE